MATLQPACNAATPVYEGIMSTLTDIVYLLLVLATIRTFACPRLSVSVSVRRQQSTLLWQSRAAAKALASVANFVSRIGGGAI